MAEIAINPAKKTPRKEGEEFIPKLTDELTPEFTIDKELTQYPKKLPTKQKKIIKKLFCF